MSHEKGYEAERDVLNVAEETANATHIVRTRLGACSIGSRIADGNTWHNGCLV